MPDETMRRPPGELLVRSVLVFAAVSAAAILGMNLRIGEIPLVWPATGVLCGAVLGSDGMDRLGIILGAVLALLAVALWQGPSFVSIGWSFGSLVVALAAAFACERLAGTPVKLDRPRHAAIFIGVSVLTPGVAGIVAGTLHTLLFEDAGVRDAIVGLWRSHALALLTVTPATMAFRRSAFRPPIYWLDHLALALYILVAVVVATMLHVRIEPGIVLLFGPVLLGPLVWWASLRNHRERSAAALILTAVAAAIGAVGPQAGHADALELQLVLGAAAVTLLASAVSFGKPARSGANAPQLLLFYSAYVLCGGLGQGLALIPGVQITFWPPAGIFLATLLLAAPRTWPWWIASAGVAELTCNALWFHNSIPLALIYFASNALEALVAATLVRRLAAGSRLQTLHDVASFAFFGAGLPPLIGATVIAATDAAIGKNAFLDAWPLIWVGDASGLLVSTPLTLIAVHAWKNRQAIAPTRLVEGLGLAAALVTVAALAFSGYLPTPYATLPLLLWIALRFNVQGATAALALLVVTSSFFVVVAAPASDGKQALLALQFFFAISALSALVVAAISKEHRDALASVRAANAELEERVAIRTASLHASEAAATARADEIGAIYKAAPIGILLLDTDLRFVRVNEQMARINGISADAHIGQPIENVLPPATVEVLCGIRDRLLSGEETVECEIVSPASRPELSRHWLVRYHALRESERRISGFIGAVVDVTQDRQREEHIRILLGEVSHRAKNLLSVVLSIARQTALSSPPDFVARFQDRVDALAASLDLLVNNEWRGVDLEDLVRAQLSHFSELFGTRIFMSGPAMCLPVPAAQALGMALHELGTNASKYGSLSNQAGRIDIGWSIAGASAQPRRLRFTWQETGGPRVPSSRLRGFGSIVTGEMAEAGLGGRVEVTYAPSGLIWKLDCDATGCLEDGGRQNRPPPQVGIRFR
ncbi:MAG: MASE1 domain-containing protein [Bauldia sp.]